MSLVTEGDVEDWWWDIKDTREFLRANDPIDESWDESRAIEFGERVIATLQGESDALGASPSAWAPERGVNSLPR